jgi:D-alanine-D-alanine ligase
MTKTTILTAFGGASPEHEVSVITAQQAMAALKEMPQYRVKPLYITKSGRWLTGERLLDLREFEDLKKLEQDCVPCSFTQNEYGLTVLSEGGKGFFSKRIETPIHAVLTAFHGSKGENGAFQGVCEMYNLPYTGSGVLASSIGMDKVAAKNICKSHGIPVVDGIDFFENEWVENGDRIRKDADQIGYPVIVKPVHLGSSIGVIIVKTEEELIRAVESAFRYDNHILIEKTISPLMEVNCSVIGSSRRPKASVCERPLGKEELLSFSDKYMADEGAKGMASADRVIPADIPEELSSAIQETSKKVFRILSCSGLARLDFLVNSDTQQFYFNEINTIPGSFSFYLWDKSGLSFTGLLTKLIDLAIDEHRQKSRRVQSYETNLLSKKAVTGLKGIKNSKI